jgi:hypothetical protein
MVKYNYGMNATSVPVIPSRTQHSLELVLYVSPFLRCSFLVYLPTYLSFFKCDTVTTLEACHLCISFDMCGL